MVDALSGSRIHTTHKTYKNKLCTNNITGLWAKISESFDVDDDRNDRYNSESKGVTSEVTLLHKSSEDNDSSSTIPKKLEKGIECIYRSCGQRENCDTCNSSVALSDEGFLVCMNP